MSLIVQKYGGSSIATVDRIHAVAAHIEQTVHEDHHCVIVVSAMGQQTDELTRLAKEVTPSPQTRELDMLLTAGERITMALLSMALQTRQIPSQSLTGSQSGILTDGNHGNARINRISGERIRSGLAKNNVVIVAGFQGVDPKTKEVTTLGRGGSDLTATAVALTLEADRCQLYKDVAGVYSADPRVVANARLLPKVSWNSMASLCWAGAGVIHHRSTHVAQTGKIPLEIRSSFDFSASGTLIEGMSPMEDPSLVALTHKKSQSLVEWSAPHASAPTVFENAVQWLWSHGEAPFLGRSYRRDNTTTFSHALPEKLTVPFNAFLAEQGVTSSALLEEQTAIVSLVGSGFLQSPELVSAVAKLAPDTRLFDVSEHRITIGVSDEKADRLLNELHAKFFESASE